MVRIFDEPVLLLLAVLLVLPGCPGPDDDPEPDAGSHWTAVVDATDDGALLSIWGPSADYAFAVGGQPELGVMYRFDGDWTPITIPEGPMLYWVYGVDGDLWTVGANGRALRSLALADAAIGDAPFDETETGTEAPLWGIWGPNNQDLWAVGGDAVDPDSVPIILHWDGAAWTEFALPQLDREARALFKVWGTSSDHVFAVGSRGIILHWDGSQWTQLASGSGDDLISLWGTDPDNITLVGGRSTGVVGHWDGSAWTVERLPAVSGLNGVWVDATGLVSVVGVNGTILTLHSGSFDFERQETDTRLVLHAIFGDSESRLTVGGSLNSNPPYEGVFLVDSP